MSGVRSVNWMTGMLLTPDHFLRQDEHVRDAFGWLLRYCVPGSGLVGAGIRAEGARRALGRDDPRLEVRDDGQAVHVTVVQARGITPSGRTVEIVETDELRATLRKSDLAGANELLVYVLHTGEMEEDPRSVTKDPANPSQAAYRRPRYRVLLVGQLA